MDDLLNEFLAETNESLAVLDVELVELEQSESGPEGDDSGLIDRLNALIPKVGDIDAFHRDDFARQLGARCAVVPAPQAGRNAAGGQKRPASGGAYRVAGGANGACPMRASPPESHCAPRLPGRPDPLP